MRSVHGRCDGGSTPTRPLWRAFDEHVAGVQRGVDAHVLSPHVLCHLEPGGTEPPCLLMATLLLGSTRDLVPAFGTVGAAHAFRARVRAAPRCRATEAEHQHANCLPPPASTPRSCTPRSCTRASITPRPSPLAATVVVRAHDAGTLACAGRDGSATYGQASRSRLAPTSSAQALAEHLPALEVLERHHHVLAAVIDVHLTKEL